jgi:potassium efflux system protein
LFYALSSTLAASAILPCGLLYFAWLQEPPFDKQTLSGALAYNLTFTLVPLLFSLSVINRALAPHGLAERYLRWPPGICQAVLTTSRGLNWFGLPLIWLYSILDTFNAGVWNDSLGRLAYIAVMGIVMMGLRGTYKQVRDYCRTCSGSCTETDLGIWARGMLAVGGYGPLALIFLSVAGYHFTAVQLGWRLYWMLIITAGIALLAGIAGRVLTIMHDGFRGHADRSLALSAAHQTSAPEETRNQVHRILRVFAWVSFVIIAWQLWSDVIPAFNYLENVRLWESLAKYGTLQPVTLRDVLWSVGIMVITLILSKHLPGLLEIVLLERLPLDRGGRYAISFICRYLIVFTGLLVVFRWIGLSWTSVQWLAAGLTVGLGFGLQEIFANLVSGLIILIERPVRVGDFVTVNGVSGHVCRVQLRATTIKDPDHRELIVPNKRFITEDVMNWTLTDRSTRVTIRVGVAYGSDTKKVQRVLHEVARANPLVKAVPGPEVVFLAFGESTLDFELRVMVATRDDYFQVTHELNMAVDAAFRKEQINIAFPQRDVHLHGLPVALSVQPIEEQSTTAITVDALGETTAGASKRAA